MDHEKISIISTIVNFLLAALKLGLGLSMNSIAIIGDAISDVLDVFSSFAAYLGIKTAKKPPDEKHPYGHFRMESLAGLIVTFLLFFSGVWILYEAAARFIKPEEVSFTFWAVGLMALSIIVNEAMARIKFRYGHKYESISLVADAEHSRADVISSFGILIGIILMKYFIWADAIVAVFVGFYVIWQSFNIGKEITDSLLDVANKDTEDRIKKICFEDKIDISELKTRKIGGVSFAEIKIKLDPKLEVGNASEIIKVLENKLLRDISELKYVIISIESHKIKRSAIVPSFGKKMYFRGGAGKIGPEKSGERTIIPVEGNKIAKFFGARQYLIIDKKSGKILKKETIQNPYFEEGFGHGVKFAKAVSADKIITQEISLNARARLEDFNIEIDLIGQDKNLEDVLKEIF